MSRFLNIWWDRVLVGVLEQTDDGDLRFTYDDKWVTTRQTQAISISLPVRTDPFSRRECLPFFGGLLPEADQREAVAGNLGVSKANDFALLDRLGGDVAGALELFPVDDRPKPPKLIALPHPLSDDELIEILNTIPTRPFLVESSFDGNGGIRMSLAGAQSKLPVVMIDGKIALPTSGRATTHILKPPISRFPATTENEAFVMRLARHVGLQVAHIEPRVVHNRTFLLIERYDRQLQEGAVLRIHQEDFCQALGVFSERKYAAEGGPNIIQSFELIREHSSRPALDILRLRDAVLYNTIIGNADAHGKNFSLLYRLDGSTRLAPFYDLLMTVVYTDLATKFAMPIGRKHTLDEMNDEAWKVFADHASIGLPDLRRRLFKMCDEIETKAKTISEELMIPGLDTEKLTSYANLAIERARLARSTIGGSSKE